MLRTHWVVGILLGLTVVALAAAVGFIGHGLTVNASPPTAPELAPADAPQQQATTAGTYVWSYGTKFVCGYQPSGGAAGQLSGEPVVKPGNYATDINIHNPNYVLTPVRKKVLLLVDGNQAFREPQQVEPRARAAIELAADNATMDDCNGLWTMLFPTTPLPTTMPLMVGYLVILSPRDLDVDVVYTAEVPGTAGSTPTGIAEDVQRVTGKRVFVPANVTP
jgi:hypothetical protein